MLVARPSRIIAAELRRLVDEIGPDEARRRIQAAYDELEQEAA